MKNEFYIKLSAEVDRAQLSKEVKKAVEAVNPEDKKVKIEAEAKDIQDTSAKIKTLDEALERVNVSVDELNSKFTLMRTSMTSGGKEISVYKDALSRTLTVYKQIIEAEENGEEATENYNAVLTRGNKKLKTIANSATNATKEIKDLTTALKEVGVSEEQFGMGTLLSQTINDVSETTKVQLESGDILTTKLKKLVNGQEDWSASIKKNTDDIGEAVEETYSWSEAWDKALRSFTAYSLASRVINTIIGSIKDMVQNVMDLDASLIELQKVSSLSGDALDSFAKKAYDAGSEVAATG